MSATVKIFKDDSISLSNDLADIDANGLKNENNNLITASGQSLDISDNFQTANAVRYMAQRSASFEAADAGGGVIQLSAYAGLQLPSQYYDGQIVLFQSPVTSDGTTSFFLKIGALITRPLLEPTGGQAHDGDLVIGQFAKARYSEEDLTFYIVKRINRDFAVFSPSAFTNVIAADTFINFDTIDENKGNMTLSGGNIMINQLGFYRIKLSFESDALVTQTLPPGPTPIFQLTAKLIRNPGGGQTVLETQIFELDAGINHADNNWQYSLRPPLFYNTAFQLSAGQEIGFAFTVDSDISYSIYNTRKQCNLFIEKIQNIGI